jgi:predicted metalloenzyme YecM
MISSAETFYTQSKSIIRTFDTFIAKHALKGECLVDHICNKCGSRQSFEALRDIFEWEGEYVYQSIISKRPIAFIKFKKPINTALGDIYYLELSDQKPDSSQKEGFDHIEIIPTGNARRKNKKGRDALDIKLDRNRAMIRANYIRMNLCFFDFVFE